MTANEAVAAVIDALHAAGVPFMLVGAYSCNVYGVPRSTKDADFVVELRPDSISKVCAQFDDRFRLDPQMSFESVTATSRHIIHVKDSPFRIELFCLSDDPHDRERFGRRRASRAGTKGLMRTLGVGPATSGSARATIASSTADGPSSWPPTVGRRFRNEALFTSNMTVDPSNGSLRVGRPPTQAATPRPAGQESA